MEDKLPDAETFFSAKKAQLVAYQLSYKENADTHLKNSILNQVTVENLVIKISFTGIFTVLLTCKFANSLVINQCGFFAIIAFALALLMVISCVTSSAVHDDKCHNHSALFSQNLALINAALKDKNYKALERYKKVYDKLLENDKTIYEKNTYWQEPSFRILCVSGMYLALLILFAVAFGW